MKPTKKPAKPVKAWAVVFRIDDYDPRESILSKTKSDARAYCTADNKLVRVEIRVIGGKK